MTIWEKAILNMQRGVKKITAAAEVVSERVKAEIDIARLRIRIDEIQSIINEQYRLIGRTVVTMKRSDLPKTMEEFIRDEAIVTAIAEIEAREKDRADLLAEIEGHLAEFRPPRKTEDASS